MLGTIAVASEQVQEGSFRIDHFVLGGVDVGAVLARESLANGGQVPGLLGTDAVELAKVEGEKISLPVWTQALQFRTDADAAFEKGDYKKSADLWTRLGKIKGAPFRTMSQDVLKKIDEKGDEALKTALALENVDEKKTALKKVVEEFKGLAAAAEAKKSLDGLK